MKKNTSAFTLIEVVVSGSILVTFGLAILGLQYVIGKTQITALGSFISVSEGNAAVSGLVRELRTGRPGDNGAYPLEFAGENEIIFFSDVDFDGQTERVRYFLEGTNLTKTVFEPVGFPVTYPETQSKTKIVSEYVRNAGVPIFYYYNSNWPQDTQNNPLPPPVELLEVKMVRVLLIINPYTNQPRKDYVLESFANIRMLKVNL